MELTKEQAKIIASMIATDIRAYIDAYRDEYEAWLETEKSQKPPHITERKEGKLILNDAG